MTKTHRTRVEHRRPRQVRVAFDPTHIDVARRMLEQAGSPQPIGDDDAAIALFTIGLGMLSGHYNELLATQLRDVHTRAFGVDGPERFHEAALALHGSTTMAKIATGLLDGAARGTGGKEPLVQ